MRSITTIFCFFSIITCCAQYEKHNNLGNSFIILEKDINLNMIFVEGGKFKMGCNDKTFKQCHKNEIAAFDTTVYDFYIGVTEVTQGQWRAIMGSLPDRYDGCELCPIVDVSWNDIQLFLRRLNNITGKHYRLPTEAEWEYAAREGNKNSKTEDLQYSGHSDINEVAWFIENSHGKTNPVGMKLPNKLGLYDMTGNVWEWCDDRYGFYDNRSIPMAKREDIGVERVTRGGAFDSFQDNCRITSRSSANPDARSRSLGFRIALSAE